MLRTFTYVNTVDDNRRYWPRDLGWQRHVDKMLTTAGLMWGGYDIAYISYSDEGMELSSASLIVDLTRPEVLETPSHLNSHGVESTPRYVVPRPSQCPLHHKVCNLFNTVYSHLDASRASMAELIKPQCANVSDAAFASKIISKIKFNGKNNGKQGFDYDRGWVSRIDFGYRQSWHEAAPLAVGQILYTPRLWRSGPAYINMSSWTSDLTFQFHQICTSMLTKHIAEVIRSDASRCVLVFFKPGIDKTKRQPSRVDIVALAECRPSFAQP